MSMIKTKREIGQLKALKRERIQILREFGQENVPDDVLMHQVNLVVEAETSIQDKKLELLFVEHGVFKIGERE